MIDACLLLTLEEVEAVVSNKVTSEVIYLSGRTGCRYISVINEEVVLQVHVITDTTIKQDNYSESKNINTASEEYKLTKMGNLDIAQKMSWLIQVEDIDNLGDEAYLKTGGLIDLHVMNNDIYYEFASLVDYNIGRDGLIELARIALQKMQ